jgi:hypothetical protein
MKNSKAVLAGFLLANLATSLLGYKITSASPDPNTIIEMRPGEKKVFEVKCSLNTLTTECVWSVAKMDV